MIRAALLCIMLGMLCLLLSGCASAPQVRSRLICRAIRCSTSSRALDTVARWSEAVHASRLPVDS